MIEPMDVETRKALQRLSREKTKLKLLADIKFDISVCEIEGWDRLEYIHELQDLLNSFTK